MKFDVKMHQAFSFSPVYDLLYPIADCDSLPYTMPSYRREFFVSFCVRATIKMDSKSHRFETQLQMHHCNLLLLSHQQFPSLLVKR